MWLDRRGTRPVRVMVCHWSRMRPVFRMKGYSALAQVAPFSPASDRDEAGAGVRWGKAWSANRRAVPSLLLLGRPVRWGLNLAQLSARRADVEGAVAVVLEAGQCRVLSKISAGSCRRRPRPSPSACDLGNDPPVRPRSAGWGQEGVPREMRRSELVTVPSFSPQAAAGRSTSAGRRVGVGDAVGDDDERAGCERGADPAGVGQADRRVGRHDPQRLDPPVGTRRNRSTALRPGQVAMRGAPQKRPTRRRSPARNPCARPALWRARRPRARPWRWAGR